jgi:7-cyano-7-deazaguanine tRNA-ribosyltransferase
MYFEIRETDGIARIGKFNVRNKVIDTPNLFPVVSPFVNDIKPKELITDFGAQCCFTNAYLVYKSSDFKDKYLANGVHSMLDFNGVIATDSGAFQHYMYGGDLNIEPSEIESFQEKINSDCPVILDIPVQFTDPYEEAKRKVEITIQRAKENLTRRTDPERAWYGPIHGSIYPDLLKKSCEEMSKLDYGIYAIGGVVKSFIDYRFDVDVQIMLNVKQWLNPSKPLHLFGLGLPSFFAMAVACGADFFDSAAYILFAKEGRYFTFSGTKHISDLIELPCCCPVCTRFTAKELNELPEKEK